MPSARTQLHLDLAMRDMSDVALTPGQRRFVDVAAAAARRDGVAIVAGPLGIGKTTLLRAIARRFASDARTLYVAEAGDLLDLERALGTRFQRHGVPSQGSMLVLDHMTARGAPENLFRWTREAGIGLVLALELDDASEAQAVHGASLVPHVREAPAVPLETLRSLLVSALESARARMPSSPELSFIARAARGRPGWIAECARLLAATTRHRGSAGLHRRALLRDVEAALVGSRSLPGAPMRYECVPRSRARSMAAGAA